MRPHISFSQLYKSMKSMFCFVNDMVYMEVKLQVLIKISHQGASRMCGVEYFD